MTRLTPPSIFSLCGVLAVLLLLSGCTEHRQSLATSDASQDAEADREDFGGVRKNAAESSTSRETPSKSGDSEVTGSASRSRGGPIREISFDTIKFDIEKGEPFERSMLTPEIEKLNERRVRIRGYMLPSFQQSGIKQFVLVRDNMECCFGPGAALYDCIIVEMVGDQTCEFSVRPIAVQGTFSVREFKGPDDTHLAIYHLDAERVR